MRFIKYFITLFLFISCNSEEIKIEKNKYQILNLIYSDFSKHQMEFFVFPAKTRPLPNGVDYRKLLNNKKYMDSLHKIVYSNKINKKDSLIRIKKHIENKKNQHIFAINLKMERYHNIKDEKLKENIIGFDKLYKNFIVSKKKDFLNIHKILPQNNDSLIAFNNELLKNKVGVEFGKFDVLVSFSDILFNKDYSKAIIIGTRSFSGTDSHSLIYFLKKQKGKWKKTYKQAI